MIRSPHRRAAGAVLVVAALAFAGTAQAGPPAKDHGPKTIHLTEQNAQLQPTFVDTGKPGPSVGDMVVARDGVLAADGSKAGTFNQVCTLVEVIGSPLTSAYECTGSIALNDGTITMQGPFVPALAEQSAAITGGTGAYAKARGEVVVRAEADELVVQLAR
jgi:allene oxide cyclase-like protein